MNLYDRLRAAGISDAEAQSIAHDHAASTIADVDTDALSKAMEEVAHTFSDTAPAAAVDAAVQEASDIVDAVTRGADALLEEQRSQYDALAKGLLALGDEIRELRTRISSETATLAKSLGSIADEPMARRSVQAEVIPAPGDALSTPEAADYSTVLSKAIAELQSTESSADRKNELRRAVSMLESGFGAAHIRDTFGL